MPLPIPKFKSESEEADWWGSPEGRDFLRQQGTASPKGSGLVIQLNRITELPERTTRNEGRG